MHHFTYRQNELYCEDVPIKKIAKEVGTPFYIYSYATLKRHFLAFDKAFEGIKRLVCYSAKANSNQAILTLLKSFGSGLDIVSGGELYRGLKAGISPDRIVYSGVGKRIDEIDYALESDILMFNVESLEELDLIDKRAGLLKKKAAVAIRVNPDVDEGYIAARALDNIEIIGIDCHIGSQITQVQPFKDALKSLKSLITELKKIGIEIKYLDMGGGLGITYDDESPPHPDEYAKVIVESLKETDLQLILEPGRVIVGNAGILVTRALFRKSSSVKEFIIVDAGMNDLLRPTLYDAFHAIWPVVKSDDEFVKADIVGPICESSDFLAADRKVPDVKNGDLIAVMSAGAYGFAMSSNYCSRLKVAEVMVRADRFHVATQRQDYKDLVKGESVPSFIGI
ncbi:MAG: diaminopimelate decarboxylase [Deltaproteobacteria bacterium]|nr:diaminopimelate decarboxylase [Deltaproteobacteria bacterium]